MNPFQSAATSIAMAQSRLSNETSNSPSAGVDDANTPRFAMSSEDRNGLLRYTNGQMVNGTRRRLLLVGSGMRAGQESSKEQAVFATSAVGMGGSKQCLYFWGPNGQETRAAYSDVKRWMTGLWRSQIHNPVLSDEDSRTGRIWNIFHGESLEQAMRTRFDPDSFANSRSVSVELCTPRKRKAVDYSELSEHDSAFEDKVDVAKSSKQISATPLPPSTSKKRRQASWPNAQMAEATLSGDNSTLVAKPINHPSGSVENTEEDWPELEMVQGRAYGPGYSRVTLLKIGSGVKQGQEYKGEQSIYARVNTASDGSMPAACYWGPPGREGKAAYDDVKRWARGLLDNQVSGLGLTDREARAVRSRNICQLTETIQNAMSTRLDISVSKLKLDGSKPDQQPRTSRRASKTAVRNHTESIDDICCGETSLVGGNTQEVDGADDYKPASVLDHLSISPAGPLIENTTSSNFTKTLTDLERSPYIVDGRTSNGQTRRVLALGTDRDGSLMYAATAKSNLAHFGR